MYAAALLAESTAPGLPAKRVTRLALQRGALGQPLDDVIVEAERGDSVSMTLSLQVKRSLAISDAASNTDFRQIVIRAYRTVISSEFKVDVDRVGAVTGELAEGSKRTLETLCERARSSANLADFLQVVHTAVVGSDEHRRVFDSIRNILLASVTTSSIDEAAYRLLRHFVLMRFDLLHEGCVLEAQTIASLGPLLLPADQPRADDLWRRILSLIRLAQGRAATFDRKTLIARLDGAFRFSGAASLRTALSKVAEEARLAANEVLNDVAGLLIPRTCVVEKVRAGLKEHRFVQITGLPGTGKSVVLRALIEAELSKGPALVLKADRLSGAGWNQYATSLGLGTIALEDLLVELAATGSATLFIDGLDRIEVGHRKIVQDILSTIFESELLSRWRVVATVRDTGIEHLRTWLPTLLQKNGALLIDVPEFNDEEARSLGDQKPALRALLFGTPQVRAIVRRPFFAAVLSRDSSLGNAPTSEVDLATRWWQGGGYAAEAASAARRRAALVALAKAGAITLGRRIPSLTLDPDALTELQADGILREIRAGQAVQFTHDIFFEWSYLQFLISEGTGWIDAIRNEGEPPVLGRVVELLSQSELKHGPDWVRSLDALERRSDVRSQWLRAWIVGPFGIAGLGGHAPTYTAAMLADNARRVAKLAVWFQAEKTTPNPFALDGAKFPNLAPTERVRLADSWAWPSDFSAWRRCCRWLIGHVTDIPPALRSDIVAIFEVWQNAFADIPDPVSEKILAVCTGWLKELEARSRAYSLHEEGSEWSSLKRGEAEELEERLRALVLRAARAYPKNAENYLAHLQTYERADANANGQVWRFSHFLSEVCPARLVDFTLHMLREELPKARMARLKERDSEFPHSYDTFGSEDWRHLAIDGDRYFFPAAPTRQPFEALFKNAPDEALRLLRELANHAIAAWRELSEVSYYRRGTPIPLTLTFPWGSATYWGDEHVYLWPLGTWGPDPVSSGLMALEEWALEEVERGTPVDDVIQRAIAGHESVAVLGVAVAVALEKKHISAVTAPFVSSQQLWSWDLARSSANPRTQLIGFQGRDNAHSRGVKQRNERLRQKLNLRWLAQVCVVQGGPLGEQVGQAITKFAQALPFEYEEERKDEARVSHVARTAEIWAELGNPANYTARPIKEGVLVEISNPKAHGPDIDAINLRQEEWAAHLPLINWVNDSYERGSVSERMTLTEAIERAHTLDASDLFDHDAPTGDSSRDQQGAVSGVASVALRFAPSLSDSNLQWAANVCERACRTPLNAERYPRSSHLSHDAAHFGLRGQLGLLRRAPERRDVLRSVLEQINHYYEQISQEALWGLIALWDKSAEIGWLGLRLAAEQSVVPKAQFDSKQLQWRDFGEQTRKDAFERATVSIPSLGKPPEPLPAVPAPWQRRQPGSSRRRAKATESAADQWERGDPELRTGALGPLLSAVPVEIALADPVRGEYLISWASDLVTWTAERLAPDWARDLKKSEWRAETHELSDWRRQLYGLLARASLHLSPAESLRRFVEPLSKTDDEQFASLVHTYVSQLACNIMDEPKFPAVPLELLQALLPRILDHDDWKSAKWNQGEIHDFVLGQIVRSLFFVAIDSAPLAARFANGKWREVEAILPVVDQVLAAHGSNPTVASAFLTLCERAFEHYPIDRFEVQLPSVLGTGGLPLGWRGTVLPARLAALIQRFAERLQPMPQQTARALLRALDALVDMGDRRAAAIQTSEAFKDVRGGVSVS
ncbi:MAG: hypothetical protein ABI885_22485 [Gammaproteobacteria bacterium]